MEMQSWEKMNKMNKMNKMIQLLDLETIHNELHIVTRIQFVKSVGDVATLNSSDEVTN